MFLNTSLCKLLKERSVIESKVAWTFAGKASPCIDIYPLKEPLRCFETGYLRISRAPMQDNLRYISNFLRYFEKRTTNTRLFTSDNLDLALVVSALRIGKFSEINDTSDGNSNDDSSCFSSIVLSLTMSRNCVTRVTRPVLSCTGILFSLLCIG